MSAPTLTAIVPWRDRDELAHTLEANAPVLRAAGAEVVVVSCGGAPERLAGVLAPGRAGLPPTRVAAFDWPSFNKALAVNVGVSVTTTPLIMVLDADVVLWPSTVDDLLAAHRPDRVVTVERVVERGARDPETTPGALAELAWWVEVVDGEGRSVRVETNRLRLADGSRAAPGLALVARQAFVAVGGMNARLQGWGWEDLDLLVRLGLAAGLERVSAGSVWHLSHGDDVRDLGGASRGESEATNMGVALAHYQRGDYRGTYADDVAAVAAGLVTRPV